MRSARFWEKFWAAAEEQSVFWCQCFALSFPGWFSELMLAPVPWLGCLAARRSCWLLLLSGALHPCAHYTSPSSCSSSSSPLCNPLLSPRLALLPHLLSVFLYAPPLAIKPIVAFVRLPLCFLLTLHTARPLFCPSSLSLFFLRAPGGAPCGPVVEAFLHRPQPGPPPLSGRGAGPPPPPVLLPPPPLPKLAHLRPGPPRVPPRSAPCPALHNPSLTLPVDPAAHGSVLTVLVVWLTLMLVHFPFLCMLACFCGYADCKLQWFELFDSLRLCETTGLPINADVGSLPSHYFLLVETLINYVAFLRHFLRFHSKNVRIITTFHIDPFTLK